LWKIKKVNLVPVSGAVERNGGSACPSAQNGNIHMFPLLPIGSAHLQCVNRISGIIFKLRYG
jgi:hypothetical protein